MQARQLVWKSLYSCLFIKSIGVLSERLRWIKTCVIQEHNPSVHSLFFFHFPFLYLFLFSKDITMGNCKEVYLPKAENTVVPFKLNHA